MIFNPKTKKLLDAYVNNPSSTVLLTGDDNLFDWPEEYLINSLLSKEYRNNKVVIEPNEKNTIGIDQIRTLKMNLSTKVSAKNGFGRVTIIKDIEKCTLEAQNSLLKLVEEPNDNNLIILESVDTKVLTTILSRCQKIPILPLTKSQCANLANERNFTEKEIEFYYFISGGNSTNFIKMVDNKLDDQIIKDYNVAKTFLTTKTDSRLQLSKDYDTKDKIYVLIDNIQKIAKLALKSNLKNKIDNRWLIILNETMKCKELINENVNIKLIYLRLCTNV
ncbi:hypothetical protein KC960_00260 [Candidatus Saccharibacteria bacterium]|nr:hypothetical protein [Candidatus Saccharibacteria bacterium]